jgi:hypothetical protein
MGPAALPICDRELLSFDPLMIKPGIAEQDSRHYPQPPVI